MNESTEQIITPMAEAIAALKEMFDSLIAGGFTERQACIVIAEMAKGVQ